jgi:integrase/recombinase XerD
LTQFLSSPKLVGGRLLDLGGEPAAGAVPVTVSPSAVVQETAMTPIEREVDEYLVWMEIHNYASTTIKARRYHLGYFLTFAHQHAVLGARDVTLELLLTYQRQLFDHRKRNGSPLSVATQAQRLVPIAQFFSWLRREHRLEENPAADLLMPRPDRKLPEATLSAAEMASLLAAPAVSRPLGLRDRAVLEVFYSCGLRRGELIALGVRDIDFDRRHGLCAFGKGSQGPLRAHR